MWINITLLSPASMSFSDAATKRHWPQRGRQDVGLFIFPFFDFNNDWRLYGIHTPIPAAEPRLLTEAS